MTERPSRFGDHGADRAEAVFAVSYWRDGGRYPRARQRGDGDAYLRAMAVMVASLRRFVPRARVDLHTNLEAGTDPELALLTDQLDVSLVATPFEHRMPDGYYHKFTASTYAIDVLAALAERSGDAPAALLVDPDLVWVRDPSPLVRQATETGLVAYPIPYPADFEDLGTTRRRLSALVVQMTGRPAGADGLIAHLGGELLGGTPEELRRFAAECSDLWDHSVARFTAATPPWLHTEEHVYSAAFHALGYGGAHTTDAVRRVWTRPGRLRNTGDADLDRTAWHALSEKGRGLDLLHADLVAGRGPFAPGVSDERFRQLTARRLSIHPSPRDRIAFRASRLNARLRGRRCVPMPA